MTESAAHLPAARASDARRALWISLVDGMLHAVMVGVAESYLGALAVELGHEDRALALLVTIPLLLGSSAQLLSSPLVTWLGGRKRLVVLGAVLQALTHVAFGWIAWTGCQSFAALLGAKVVYWISGMMIAPPWGAWMASLIAGRDRERYFAWRSGAVQTALLAAFGSAGWLLWRTQELGRSPLTTLAVLNVVAVIARSLSALCLALQADPSAPQPEGAYSWRRILTAARSSEWRPALYVVLLMLGTHTAVPFFTPYMLRTLHLDYSAYALLLAVPIVTKAVVSPLLFSAAGAIGMRRLLVTSTVLVSLVAFLWARSETFQDLVVAQIVSGIAWGAFEYTSYQLLLSSPRAELQVEFLSLANSLIGVAQLSGALIGAQLLSSGWLDYNQVFLLSAVGRALPVGLAFLWIPLRLPVLERMFWRIFSVRPAGGTLRGPILTASGAPRTLAPGRLGDAPERPPTSDPMRNDESK